MKTDRARKAKPSRLGCHFRRTITTFPVMPNCRVLPLLKGQKALVTGASSGTGKAIALAPGHAGVGPGAIRRPINMRAWDTPNHYAEPLKRIPYGRIGEPEEIGRAAVVAR
jgi:NAD(P)-dependent dehydrogenase (short-subunit alcohol dehydrogenase family)